MVQKVAVAAVAVPAAVVEPVLVVVEQLMACEQLFVPLSLVSLVWVSIGSF